MKKLLLFLTMALTIVTFICCTADDEITEEGVPTMARATRSANNEGSGWTGNLPPDTLTPSMDVFFCDTTFTYEYSYELMFSVSVSCQKDIFARLNPSASVSLGMIVPDDIRDLNVVNKNCKAHNGEVYWQFVVKLRKMDGSICPEEYLLEGETPLHRETVPVVNL